MRILSWLILYARILMPSHCNLLNILFFRLPSLVFCTWCHRSPEFVALCAHQIIYRKVAMPILSDCFLINTQPSVELLDYFQPAASQIIEPFY